MSWREYFGWPWPEVVFFFLGSMEMKNSIFPLLFVVNF